MPTSSDPRERDNLPPPLQLSQFQGHPDPTRLLNYLYKYPADKEGQELHPDSRTWQVYIDEHESYDYDMIKAFRDNVDALLVFAALFSSVVTGFVVPAAERLEPDNAQISTSILFEAAQLLRANGNATLIEATPRSELHPDSTTHSLEDICVAWMFFASLALSLATALVSILAKQWLQEFTALVPGDGKRRSLTRQFRFGGMQKWKFVEIVGFLPLLLHLSLLLFLVGLCVYVQRFHWSFFTMVGFVSLCAIVFYVVTATLPAVYLLILRYYIVNPWSSIQKLRRSLSSSSDIPQNGIPMTHVQSSRATVPTSSANDATPPVTDPSSTPGPVSRQPFAPFSLSTQERKYIDNNTSSLEFSSLEWLYSQTTNKSVQRIVLHALARALEQYASCHPNEAQCTLPVPRPILEDMDSLALALINGISGSEHVADDIPQLLDFHIHSSHVLKRETDFPASRWPPLIDSPHLLSFTDRNLLPLNSTITVGGKTDYPLHIACRSERWDLVGKCFHQFDRSQWRKADSDGWLPLGRAASSPQISITLWKEIWWRKTDDVTLSVNGQGDTALHLICSSGASSAKIAAIDAFLPDLMNIQRPDKQTPLHRLCDNTVNPTHRVQIAKDLLSKRPDLSIVESDPRTLLHFACRKPHPAEFIETLCSHLQTVENRLDILNQWDKYRSTALHFAGFLATLGSQSVQAMISAGADANIADNRGNLPLHDTCHTVVLPRRDLIAVLLDHTRQINQRNEKGETPLDTLMARKGVPGVGKHRQEICELMRTKGAKLASELGPAEKTESG